MGWLGYGTCLTQAKSEMTPLISALWARFHSIKPNFTKPKATRTRSLFSKRFDKTFGISKCFAQFCLDAVDLSANYVRSCTKNHEILFAHGKFFVLLSHSNPRRQDKTERSILRYQKSCQIFLKKVSVCARLKGFLAVNKTTDLIRPSRDVSS